VVARYFGSFHPTRHDRWVYGDRETGAYLHRYAWTIIVRHVPVTGRNSPDDPALAQYWAERRRKRKPPQLAPSWHRTLCVQNGLCPLCRDRRRCTYHDPDALSQWEAWYAAVRKAMTHQAIPEHDSGRTTHRLVHAHCARRHNTTQKTASGKPPPPPEPPPGPRRHNTTQNTARASQAGACPPTRAA